MSDPATLHAILKGMMRMSKTPKQVREVWRDNAHVIEGRLRAEPDLYNDLKAYGAQRTAELEKNDGQG